MNDSLLLIDNIKVPKVPFSSTVFVFQSNNKMESKWIIKKAK